VVELVSWTMSALIRFVKPAAGQGLVARNGMSRIYTSAEKLPPRAVDDAPKERTVDFPMPIKVGVE
jgi:hypothetical protein